MPIFKLLISAILITMLVGCELMPTRKTAAQTKLENDNRLMEIANKENEACMDAMDKNALDYVANNIRYIEGITKNKYELMQSTRFFDENDKDFLIKFLNEISACGNTYIDRYSKVDGRFAANFRNFVNNRDQVYFDFMQKKINVMQLNAAIESLITQGMEQEQAIIVKKNKEIENAHYKEVDRNLEAYKADQQVAAARAANAPPTTNWGQVYIDLAKKTQERNKTTFTNCNVYGNSVNCTSNEF